tara:strand:+ start:418 stop:1968 length:1551 start_codon:yes stop_codon:yes gene_type:complete
MKKQNDYFKKIEKGTLEDAVQQIWNGDDVKNPKSYTVTEELTILDFDKMSDFKKASNYLKKQGIQYKNPYPFVLTIHNIDKLSKIKTKRDVENFLKKGRFKFDIRYAESTEHKGTKLDEEQSKQIAKDIKKKFQAQLKKKRFLALNDVESYVKNNTDLSSGTMSSKIVKELGKLGVTVAGKFPHTREEVTSKQLQKALGKAKGMKVKHDCATKVEHAEWGKGNPLKEQHTLDEDGTVTHYDIMFEHGLEKDVPVSTLNILVSGMHEHAINPDKNELQEMNPTDHVKKKGDKFCVYNADGTIAKEFDNREDAEKYAIANHDKLMATKKEEVEIHEQTQFQVVYTNKKSSDKGLYRLEKDRTLGKIYNQREAEKMIKKLSADKRNSDFEYRFVPKGNINRSGEVVTPVDFYKVGFKNRKEQVSSPSKYIDILNKLREETEYQKFFKSAMKKFGVKSPSELDGDKEKEFYDYVDKNWKGKNEPKEVGEKRKPNGKTLTGKPKDNIDVNPKTSDIKAGKY